jgi:LmbE family N-acetylglucosaminyl deacetylase
MWISDQKKIMRYFSYANNSLKEPICPIDFHISAAAILKNLNESDIATFMDKKKLLQKEKILVFEPHPDDVAYNILGSVAKWLGEGKEIMICTITTGNNSTFKKGVSSQEIQRIMHEEHQQAMGELGIPKDHLVQWEYDDLGLDPAKDRDPLLKAMVCLIRKFRPITVITMDPRNMLNEENPDHRLVAMTGFEAAALAAYPNKYSEQFKEVGVDQHFVSRVLFYMTPDPDTFVDIKGEPLGLKKKIGSIYKSQLDLMIGEIDIRLRNMGLNPGVLDEIDPMDLWESVCDSMGKERAQQAAVYYKKNPAATPRVPLEYAEAFRLIFLGAVEKVRNYLPKELISF